MDKRERSKMNLRKVFTSESVSEGHPDKLCDQISDAILDACLKQDPYSRVACECYVTTNHLIIGGEITTKAKIDYRAIARQVMTDIGYTNKKYGLDAKSCKIDVYVKQQSPDIARGVDALGAGDQGIMFGYATDETKGYMPLPIVMAHKLVRVASQLRKNGEFKWARPDMKSQVSVDYTDPKHPKLLTVLMSIQHDPDYKKREFKKFIKEKIMIEVAKSFHMNTDFKVEINPTGKFVIGGPKGDVGLTGRKIIVDTYGGSARHGGGAFSGRLTLGLVVAGVVAKKIYNVDVKSEIVKLGKEEDKTKFKDLLEDVKNNLDSIGGVIKITIPNLEIGLGEPYFDSLESLFSHALFSVGAVKGVSFGSGFSGCSLRGSEYNDLIIDETGKTATNNNGGINGGLSNGNDVIINVAVKPTPSIGKAQMTYNFKDKKVEPLEIGGRHDIAIILRMGVILESVCQIVLTDLYLRKKALECA